VRSRLETLFADTPAAIALFRGPSHLFEFASESYLDFMSVRPPVVGKAIREAVPELQGRALVELLDRIYATGEHFTATEVHSLFDRQRDAMQQNTFFNLVYQPTFDVNGRIDGVFANGVDVTELVSARQRVQASEQKLRTLLACLSEGLIVRPVHSGNGVEPQVDGAKAERFARSQR
jgi:PAS domain-containing protein